MVMLLLLNFSAIYKYVTSGWSSLILSLFGVFFFHRRAYNSQRARSIKKKVKAFSAPPFVLKAVMAGQVG